MSVLDFYYVEEYQCNINSAWRHATWSTLVLVMTYRLFGNQALPTDLLPSRPLGIYFSQNTFYKRNAIANIVSKMTAFFSRYHSGPWFNIKMSSYQYRKSHCGDKTILWPSYLHNGFPILVRRHLYIESGPWCIKCMNNLPDMRK